MKEILVLINGEPIKVKWHYSRKIGYILIEAFKKSTQKYSKTAKYLVRDKDFNLLHPDDRVGYLDHIEVVLDA